jgi:hypothetical protein
MGVGSFEIEEKMKIFVVICGLLFAYWNYCGLSENLLAFWHLIALMASSVVVGLLVFDWLFDLITMPNYSARIDDEI